MVSFSILSAFGRDAGSREAIVEFGAYGGAGVIRNGVVDVLDAVAAAPVFRMRWRPLKVLRRRPRRRRGREGPAGGLRLRTAL